MKVHFPHGTGDAVVACRGTNEPTVSRKGVVDVFAFTDGAGFVVVRVLWVTSLNGEGKKKISFEYIEYSNRFKVFNDTDDRAFHSGRTVTQITGYPAMGRRSLFLSMSS